jgi:hypothetical protein
MSIDTNVSALVSNIAQDTDKGYTAYSMLSSEPTLGDVQHVFDVLGLRWNPIVEQDAINALNDYGFAYFADRLTFAEQALAEMHIYSNPSTGQGVWHMSDMGDYIRDRWELTQAERAQYGVPVTSFLDNEWACPREQERFYKTDAWRRCSAAQRYMWEYKCRRCGARGAGLHVHHLMPIMSGYGRNFDLNFADWKLTLYCEDCHREYHKRAVRAHASHEYDIVTEQDARADKATIRQTWKVVHDLGRCQYCACHGLSA